MPVQTTRLIRRFGHVPASAYRQLQQGWFWLFALQNRQRAMLLQEMTAMDGFMPLLMKQRNGRRWTSEDRQQIRKQMSSLARLSPYVIALLLPGGLLALPLMAWWLDRRRQRRGNGF